MSSEKKALDFDVPGREDYFISFTSYHPHHRHCSSQERARRPGLAKESSGQLPSTVSAPLLSCSAFSIVPYRIVPGKVLALIPWSPLSLGETGPGWAVPEAESGGSLGHSIGVAQGPSQPPALQFQKFVYGLRSFVEKIPN
ncbi:hypothetical protein CISG_09469 [Coccidioides immitis RMSCC 3703]|uniref:Uncharacterized protein n=2 Tax=Coccidioides immitis TaxID=5501 RepID=A0A0J8RDK9_COCIT|nr:hypothetical protein CIRG_08543 [Coccidioides immitis RMSCC 2394]KMU81983.1 hypothetical protein CISG_09469 [Coccidioides immitis RMSCC 3703]